MVQTITEYYRVLQSIAEYYYRVLQSVTEHYRVLQSTLHSVLHYTLTVLTWICQSCYVVLNKTFCISLAKSADQQSGNFGNPNSCAPALFLQTAYMCKKRLDRCQRALFLFNQTLPILVLQEERFSICCFLSLV